MATADDDLYHFIAYTPCNGILWELDGLAPAPISHGSCSVENFPDLVMPVLQRRIERYSATEIRFNLLAMVKDPKIRAREIGDNVLLRQEERKLAAWQWENALRQHNFVGMIGRLLRATIVTKLRAGHENYDSWIIASKAQTEERVTQKRRKTDRSSKEG